MAKAVPLGLAQGFLLSLLLTRIFKMTVRLHGAHLLYYYAGIVINVAYLKQKCRAQIKTELEFWINYCYFTGSRPLSWIFTLEKSEISFVTDEEAAKDILRDEDSENRGKVLSALLMGYIERDEDSYPSVGKTFRIKDFTRLVAAVRFLFGYLINCSASTFLTFFFPLLLSESDNDLDFVLNSVAALFLIQLDDLDALRVYNVLDTKYIYTYKKNDSNAEIIIDIPLNEDTSSEVSADEENKA